jgi:hypothetical protein
LNAFIAETKREYLDGETFDLLVLFIIEKMAHLKMCLAVDVMFEILKSLGNNQR